jgi:hypothetical protein
MPTANVMPGGIRISGDVNLPGEGISTGLARGLLIEINGQNITQEGMGIGSPALRTPRATHFSRQCRTERSDPGAIVKRFLIDSRMAWTWKERVSPVISLWAEKATSLYMQLPFLQNRLMAHVPPLRERWQIHPVFVSEPPIAEARFVYTVSLSHIDVACHIRPLQGVLPRVCLFNELGADYFTASWRDGEVLPPPRGWERITGRSPDAWLYDPVHGLRFRIRNVTTGSEVHSRVYWGRERSGDLCWAGFGIELDATRSGIPAMDVQYRVELVQEGKSI